MTNIRLVWSTNLCFLPFDFQGGGGGGTQTASRGLGSPPPPLPHHQQEQPVQLSIIYNFVYT